MGTKFLVWTVTPWKIKVQTIQYRKSRIWEMKEDEYTKSLYKNQVCAIFWKARYLEKRFTQIYKALYGNAMLVSLSGTPIWLLETNRNICFRVFLLMLEELVKIKVIFNVFNPHKSFPRGQLNATSCKSLEIHESSLAKRRTLSNQKFVYVKLFTYCNTSWLLMFPVRSGA